MLIDACFRVEEASCSLPCRTSSSRRSRAPVPKSPHTRWSWTRTKT